MRSLVPIALATAALAAGCGLRSTAPRAEVHDAWVRLPALPGAPAAGYFRIEIGGGTRETLVAIESSSAERIDMHMTATENGRSTMRPIAEASTRLGRPILFEPGGNHLMLHGLDPTLGPGDTIELRFRFLLAPPATARATLIEAGGEPPHARH